MLSKLANRVLKVSRDYWIFPVALTICCFVVFMVSIYLPPPSAECLKPTSFCEMSPWPLFAGIGSMLGVFLLYTAIIKPEFNSSTESQDGKEDA